MRIIKFKYRHTEKAHWEGKEWTKRKKEEKEKTWRHRRADEEEKGKISTEEQKRKLLEKSRCSSFFCMLTLSYNCGVKARFSGG